MIDSPCHPYGDTNFMIIEGGIGDPDDKAKAAASSWKNRTIEKKTIKTSKTEDDEVKE